MNHLMIMPIVIPLLTGAFLLVMYRYNIGRQRSLGIGSCLLLVIFAIWAVLQAGVTDYTLYRLGNWQPPFGIVLVLDRLSATMLLLTALLSLFCVLYASRGSDREGSHFHALMQFQLMGINGAFLTGDLFNLFVFFEVLLIASYALLLHGGGRARSRAGLHYVIINLAGSALFLLALGLLYGLTGTLNMADLARVIANAPESDLPLLKAASLLLMVVFGIKAALLPLLFWLPRAYSAASAPVAALFAIMTKVGFYAMVRVFLVVFGLDEGAPANDTVMAWLWPMALITLALGGIGVLGAASLRTLTAYMVIVSVGILLATLSRNDEQLLAASLFYLLHSTIMTAVFFLLADLIGRYRDDGYDRFSVISPLSHRWVLGSVFLVAAISMASLPPFSGFVSKAWILQSSTPLPDYLWLWGAILISGLLIIAALSRAGSGWFWRPEEHSAAKARAVAKTQRLDYARTATVCVMIAISFSLALFAQPVMDYLEAAARLVYQPSGYVDAVLGDYVRQGGEVSP
ncbi:monovalent cation/H+ antiporter subunit D [Marinobacter sp. TBZ242]|uniref:Monovalent cation/H+ antiporter subunit D n=1 Tax=Marinobacter azerbaijanicus TaxID=3050455 RepID=A0ABT7IAK5_9GAMM|nr:monovalent cation/H+ antiporter subunit D [Marinobacter sp. TBZ242]MDL0430827.1 monovalent cation/H+ antiporter subunit D [Marinobacter sp. TBZ242]